MTSEVRRHIWAVKFLTFASRCSLLTVELISQPSNLIKRCREEMARRQERAAFLHPRPSFAWTENRNRCWSSRQPLARRTFLLTLYSSRRLGMPVCLPSFLPFITVGGRRLLCCFCWCFAIEFVFVKGILLDSQFR